MKKLLLMALVALLALPAAAQTDPESQNVINVTGKVEKKIAPDRIYIRIVIKDNDIKGLDVNQIQSKMIAALKKLGIGTDTDLKVDDMDNALRKRNQVQTTKSYQLMVTSATQMAQVYGALADLGISNMSVTEVDNSQMEKYRLEARREAIRQAKQNAEVLAEAIGQSIGPAVYIYDNGGYSDMPVMFASRASNKMLAVESAAADDTEGPSLEFREITISHSVNVRFKLNQ